MPRSWISVPIARTGIRIGRSIADSELRPHLPSWRKWELCHGLIKAAEGRGEKMTKDEAAYIVDKALATGGLDSAGNIIFPVKGTREEIVGQIMETAAAWGQPMTRQQAEARTDAAIAAKHSWPWRGTAIALGAAMGALFAARIAGVI